MSALSTLREQYVNNYYFQALSSENNIHPYDPEQFADLTNFYAKESNELCSIACPLFAAAWKGDLPTLAQ